MSWLKPQTSEVNHGPIRVSLSSVHSLELRISLTHTILIFSCSTFLVRSLMEPLRHLFWLWVVLGMIFVSMVIGLIFFLINKCISKKAAEQYNTNTPSHTTPQYYAQSSKYHLKDLEDDLPPLPPRTQFLTSCPKTESYENLVGLPDYVKVDDNAPPPPYHHTETLVCKDNDSLPEDYDDIGADCQIEEDYDDLG
ncbi:uncharacterized protein LOC110537557 [Oncorhynchus mykiss]|uniref:uncharacterized protein LOC110537557 n=1 Tax=Oncorhynchus mykiss TaxID=8022 RepID=UPI0018779080|nr:uncharacterized protein LOC110537557 [Oncorhynchus mykiss]